MLAFVLGVIVDPPEEGWTSVPVDDADALYVLDKAMAERNSHIHIGNYKIRSINKLETRGSPPDMIVRATVVADVFWRLASSDLVTIIARQDGDVFEVISIASNGSA